MVARPLNEMHQGDCGVVIDNSCGSAQASRLAELGLAEGESIHILRGGSPMLLQVGGSRVCLRADDTAQIAVLCVR